MAATTLDPVATQAKPQPEAVSLRPVVLLHGFASTPHTLALVASHLLKRLDRGRRVRRVVTLGTPHAGAPIAWLGAAATLGMSPSLRQILPGSCFLAELAAAPVLERSELVALASEADAVVPERFARLDTAPRQRTIVLAHLNHMQLVFHRDALAIVGELLGASDPGSAARAAHAHTRRATARAA